MQPIYHILNGDALKDQFPTNLEGETIIMRECLIDGEVDGETIEEFYETRDRFIASFPGQTQGDYFRITVPEIEKIRALPAEAEVNLWFEDDLFCQVNFWFVVWLLKKYSRLFLIRPEVHTHYGFARYDQKGLEELLQNRIKLQDIDQIATLWDHYKSNNLTNLHSAAEQLSAYPFILQAVQAHLDRFPENGLSRPEKTMLEIMDELDTKEFGKVFQEFNKRESIYGFGDLQAKRIFDQVLGV